MPFQGRSWREVIQKYDLRSYGLLLMVSLLVAFFRIGFQSLWNDEATSAIFATKYTLSGLWQYVPKHDLHPPLYYSVLHGWSVIFGGSETALRSLSAVFFSASTLLIYRFGTDIFSSKRTAFITALLYATNPFAVLYAQETRSYSMLLFLVLAHTYIFYRLLHEERPAWWYRIGYLVVGLILIYTNIISLVVPFVHGCALLLFSFRKPQKIWSLVPLYALLGAAILPMMRILQAANAYDYSYYYSERFSLFMKTVVAVAGFIGGRINVLNGKWHIYPLLLTSLAVYLIVAVLIVRRWRTINTSLAFFLTTLFGAMLIITHIKFPVPDPKYFYPAFPFFILTLGYIFEPTQKTSIRRAAIVALFGLNILFLYHYFFVKVYERENWRSVVAQVESDVKTNQLSQVLIISPFPETHPMWRYYQTLNIPAIGALEQGGTPVDIEKALVAANISNYEVVYVSQFLANMYDSTGVIPQFLEHHGYAKTAEFVDTKVEFWRYDKQ